MSTKAWRISGLVLTGLGVLFYSTDWYMKGSLSSLGWVAFILMLTGFGLGLGLLASGK
jgi:hypothetical protein